jgi:hypothetical protein
MYAPSKEVVNKNITTVHYDIPFRNLRDLNFSIFWRSGALRLAYERPRFSSAYRIGLRNRPGARLAS